MVWLPGGEKISKIPFDRMYERDGHTDTHRMTASAALAKHRAAKIIVHVYLRVVLNA